MSQVVHIARRLRDKKNQNWSDSLAHAECLLKMTLGSRVRKRKRRPITQRQVIYALLDADRDPHSALHAIRDYQCSVVERQVKGGVKKKMVGHAPEVSVWHGGYVPPDVDILNAREPRQQCLTGDKLIKSHNSLHLA